MKKVLIVIDMLKDFLKPNGKLYIGKQATNVIAGVKALTQEFMDMDDIILFTSDYHDEDDREFKTIPPHCIAGTSGAQIVSELDFASEYASRVVKKNTFDGFISTALQTFIKVALREKYGEAPDPQEVELTLCGVCTSICVMETAASAYKLGYNVRVVESAVRDFDPIAEDLALKRMAFLFQAEIVNDVERVTLVELEDGVSGSTA